MNISVTYGELIGLSCAFIWALHSLLLRTQVHKASPALLNSFRCAVASVFFWILLLFGPPLATYGEVTAWEWFLLAGSVLIVIGVGDTLHMVAIREIGVSRTMALSGIHPLTTLLFEWLLLDTPFSNTFVLGCSLVVAGVVCLSSQGQVGGRDEGEVPVRWRYGIALSLVAALFWGLGAVMIKPAIVHLTPVQANSVRMPLVALMLYLFCSWGRKGPGLGHLDWRTLCVMGAVGILGMGLGSMFFLMAIDLIGPAKTTTLSAISPVLALVMAVVFLKEKVNLRIILGVFLCVAGVWLVL